jgi:hypothetical protein
MLNLDEEKEKLFDKLSEQYAKNIINIEEYERIVEYVNKIETNSELIIIERVIDENNQRNNDIPMIPHYKNNEKHLAVFSWKSTNLKSHNGNGGKYLSLFGTNRIVIDNLPKGKTVINVDSIFGLTEIVLPKGIKIINNIVPVFSGIFIPEETNETDGEIPELYITGKAVFGNITIIRK